MHSDVYTRLNKPLRGVLHDKDAYPNPDIFDPTRYLTPSGELDKDSPDPTEFAFGFGRRICPGRHFAMDSMWITVAYILATLKIEMARDEFGNVLVPSGEYTPGLLRCVRIPLRSSFEKC